MDESLLRRIEDAGINASAPAQQRWLDGWIVRYSPGKARRARCIHAVAAGHLPLDEKLRLAGAVYAASGLPMVVRITPYTQPSGLDAELSARGYPRAGDSRVMVRVGLPPPLSPAPHGLEWIRLDADRYAEVVGELRGSPPEHRRSHAERLRMSPIPYSGHALQRTADGTVLACGQFAREGELVGLYDIYTHPGSRSQGLASRLCERLLSLSANDGGEIAYLQVEADNDAAQAVYRRLGFTDAYGYHYRQPA